MTTLRMTVANFVFCRWLLRFHKGQSPADCAVPHPPPAAGVQQQRFQNIKLFAMYRAALRSARITALVRQSPRFFSSSPFEGTPSPPTPPPKTGRKKKAEGEAALHTSDLVDSLSHKLGVPKDTCKLVVSAAFDFIGSVSPRQPVSVPHRPRRIQLYCYTPFRIMFAHLDSSIRCEGYGQSKASDNRWIWHFSGEAIKTEGGERSTNAATA